jgi:hypothetical protein
LNKLFLFLLKKSEFVKLADQLPKNDFHPNSNNQMIDLDFLQIGYLTFGKIDRSLRLKDQFNNQLNMMLLHEFFYHYVNNRHLIM